MKNLIAISENKFIEIFKKVRCKAYLKKVNDGVHIRLFNPDGTDCGTTTVNDPSYKAIAYVGDKYIKDLSEWDGDGITKVYRERIEHEFDGFIVGVTRICTKGYIGTDWSDNPYQKEYGYCYKIENERPEVAIVYFRNNCKRYVLLSDIEEGE